MSDALRVLVLNERDPLHPNAGGAELHVHQIFRTLIGVALQHSRDRTLHGRQQRRGHPIIFRDELPVVVICGDFCCG